MSKRVLDGSDSAASTSNSNPWASPCSPAYRATQLPFVRSSSRDAVVARSGRNTSLSAPFGRCRVRHHGKRAAMLLTISRDWPVTSQASR